MSASRRRVILRTKAEIAAAVCNRELSVEEACNSYAMTLGDIVSYLDALGANCQGPVAGLEKHHAEQASNAQYRKQHSPEPCCPAMSTAEALKILALQEGASESQIRSAHRRLMMRNHPDRGGSDYFAAKINGAKDVLLGR